MEHGRLEIATATASIIDACLADLNDAHALALMGPDRDSTIESIVAQTAWGPSAALLCDRYALGCLGIAGRIPGVGEGWAICTQRIRQWGYGFAFTRFCRRLVADWIRQHDYHRVQVSVPATAINFQRFAQALGFTYETSLRHAARDGQDVLIYSILRRLKG